MAGYEGSLPDWSSLWLVVSCLLCGEGRIYFETGEFARAQVFCTIEYDYSELCHNLEGLQKGILKGYLMP